MRSLFDRVGVTLCQTQLLSRMTRIIGYFVLPSVVSESDMSLVQGLATIVGALA